MPRDYEHLDNGTLFQRERELRREYGRVRYGDEGERQSNEIEHKLKDIKQEWERRSFYD